jgi:hypothetical protein
MIPGLRSPSLPLQCTPWVDAIREVNDVRSHSLEGGALTQLPADDRDAIAAVVPALARLLEKMEDRTVGAQPL